MTTQRPINPVLGPGVELARLRFIARLPATAGLFECWRMPTTRDDGYAVYGSGVFFDGEKSAHRIAWRAANDMASVPEGHEVDHMCFVRNCVNPLHLRCIPLRDNRWQRPPPLKTLCPRGHPYDGDNLYVNPKTGQRACRECTRAALRRSHAKHRDKRNAERALHRLKAKAS